MNIEKLAKHLKKFSLDEIEMIAECDCKTELEHLLNANKISFEQGVYKYVEKENFDYGIFVPQNNKNTISDTNLNFTCAVNYFFENYAGRYCKATTFRKYQNQFKSDITPFFKNRRIEEVQITDIRTYYLWCKNRNFKPVKIKNNLALLKQFLKYFQNLGVIECTCNFQVRRLSDKTNFTVDIIIFEV